MLPLALRASGLLSLLVQRKVTKETHPRRRGLRASCPATARGRSGVRWMYVRVHSANGRTSCAPSCGLFLRTLAAPQGARLGGILPQKQQLARSRHPFVEVVQGCTDSWINGAVRGAEHRSRGGKSPQGRGDGSPRLRSSTWDVLSEQPRAGEKRRAVRFARCESDHRVRCLAFLVTFWAMPKSNSARPQARESSALERRSWSKELDYTRLLSRALRAIRCANVRSGILPPQSGFRRNDEPKASAAIRQRSVPVVISPSSIPCVRCPSPSASTSVRPRNIPGGIPSCRRL